MSEQMIIPLYRKLAQLLQWRNTLLTQSPDNIREEWLPVCEDQIHKLESSYLPHGSGIDCGCKINMDKSTPYKIIITFEFHHMNEWGGYDGWTQHTCIITPALTQSFELKITGRNRNMIKDYLYESFDFVLKQEVFYNI